MTIEVSVSIDVPDLIAATAFYVNALGCEKRRNLGKSMVMFSAGNADIYLILREANTHPATSSSADLSRTYARHWTPVHLDFGVSSVVDGTIQRIVAAGGVRE